MRTRKLVPGSIIKPAYLVIAALGVLAGVSKVEGGYERDSMNHGEEHTTKTLVIIGASYAKGLHSEKPLAGYRIVNKGVNGQQSFEMLDRFETDVVALRPDAVLIWGFINDIFRGDPGKIDDILARTRESFTAMVKMARKNGVIPILATEVTIRSRDGWKETLSEMVAGLLGKTSYQDYVNKHVKETNRWIRAMAAQEGIQLLDFETVLADQQGVRRQEFSKPDGSHISEAGYAALIRYVEERLR